MEAKEGTHLAEQAIARLMEHVDNVQILMSWNDGGGTAFVSHGAGNWFARKGLAQRWLQDCDDANLSAAIGDELNGGCEGCDFNKGIGVE